MSDVKNPFLSTAVNRYFEYRDSTLFMHSRVPSEFGFYQLLSYIRFYPTDPADDADGRSFLTIHQNCDDSADIDVPLEFRVGEMNYLLSVSLLFNPKNQTDYGLPKESQTSEL